MILLAVVPSLACFGVCEDFEPPETEACNEAADPSIAVSSLDIELVDVEGTSMPVSDGALLPFQYGAQGGAMLNFVLRFEAPSRPRPSCFGATVELIMDSGETFRQDRPLIVEEAGDAFVTGDIWFVFEFPEPSYGARLVAEAYGQRVERRVFIQYIAPPDGGSEDAGEDDSGILDAGDTADSGVDSGV